MGPKNKIGKSKCLLAPIWSERSCLQGLLGKIRKDGDAGTSPSGKHVSVLQNKCIKQPTTCTLGAKVWTKLNTFIALLRKP